MKKGDKTGNYSRIQRQCSDVYEEIDLKKQSEERKKKWRRFFRARVGLKIDSRSFCGSNELEEKY